jgi:hypothetical protein
MEIHRAGPDFRADKRLPLGFGILASIHLPHGISHGETFFDTEPHFPCFALFLDSSHSLILKRKATITAVAPKPKSTELLHKSEMKGIAGERNAGNEMAGPMQEFVRIGIANFLRTEKQRNEMPLFSEATGFQSVPYGPITAQDERTLVTIF